MSKLTLASQAEQSRIEEQAEKQDEADARERAEAEAEGLRLDEEEARERKRKGMGKGKATGQGNRGSAKVDGNKTQHERSIVDECIEAIEYRNPLFTEKPNIVEVVIDIDDPEEYKFGQYEATGDRCDVCGGWQDLF